jgi:hypothetical protein
MTSRPCCIVSQRTALGPGTTEPLVVPADPALRQHCRPCCRHLCARALTVAHLPTTPADAPSDPVLKKVFKGYCKLRLGQGRQMGSSVQQMNAAQFNRMCHDAGISEPAGEGPGGTAVWRLLARTTSARFLDLCLLRSGITTARPGALWCDCARHVV